jgi:transposase
MAHGPYDLTEFEWNVIKPLLPNKATHCCAAARCLGFRSEAWLVAASRGFRRCCPLQCQAQNAEFWQGYRRQPRQLAAVAAGRVFH